MQRVLLKSKIHRATVTGAELDYEGSIMIDRDLLEASDIVVHEQVQIYDINNGSRFTTYAIAGERGSGIISVQGAAARLVQTGDLVIIASYASFSEDEIAAHHPKVVFVDEQNRQKAIVNP